MLHLVPLIQKGKQYRIHTRGYYDFGQESSGATISAANTLPSEFWTCAVSATAGGLSSQASADIPIYSNNWSDCPVNQTLGQATLFLGENAGDEVGGVYSSGDVDGDGLDDI